MTARFGHAAQHSKINEGLLFAAVTLPVHLDGGRHSVIPRV
jgi:hypothetical protein